MPNQIWNKIPQIERERIVEVALSEPDKSPITDKNGYYVSESSVYRILKERGLIRSPVFQIITAADNFSDPTIWVNELWQSDFTYFKVIDWGWYYLCTVLDDSRYILAWKLCRTMKADDVINTVRVAIRKTGIKNVAVEFRPSLLSDNGSSFIAKSFKSYLNKYKIYHTRGKPYHPQTQGNGKGDSPMGL